MADVIFPASLALRALRSTSYKDTAHAVAELIDNSFDAGATQIGVVLLVNGENAPPHEIAVLDNGHGMGAKTLRKSVQYGFSGGDSELDKPLGKFGVGLVAASFSQCSDLTVMSWQDGRAANDHTLSTRIKIPEGEMSDADNVLPEPSLRPLPDWAHLAFRGMASPLVDIQSGSLVIWRNVQPSWRRARTLSSNFANLCGRIYRNFIVDHKLVITVNVFDISCNDVRESHVVPAVDPMFLQNWGAPELRQFNFVDDNTPFDPYTGFSGDSGRNKAGDYEPELIEVKDGRGGIIGCYLLTASYRSERVLDAELMKEYDDPGDTPLGRLAKRLQGVSILRAQREIDLDPSWLRLSQTVDRWVSVSLDFDPDLDDTFGISNDKQKAHRLTEAASLSRQDIKDRIKELEGETDRDDRMLTCLTVALQIKTRLNEMQGLIRKQRKGIRSGQTNGELTRDPSNTPTPELVASSATLRRGRRTVPQDDTRAGDHPEKTADAYQESTSDGRPAREIRPAIVIESDLQVDVVADPHEVSSKMFRVTLSPAHMIVHLIERHPLYECLSRLLLTDADRDPDEPEPTIQDAMRAVRGLLISYARAQVEAMHHNPEEAAEFERCSVKWGEVAERLFRDPDE